MFYNPTLDLYFSLAANNEEDDEVFDTAVIFTMDGDHPHTLFTISHDRSQEEDEDIVGYCRRCGEPLYDGDHGEYCDSCYGDLYL